MSDRGLQAERIDGGVHEAVVHDSALKHATGAAIFIDDMAEPRGTLHLAVGLSDIAHGRIRNLDLAAVREAPGVVDVIAAADIPGLNDTSPTHSGDDPVLADGDIRFLGQPVFAVAAESRDAARRAVGLARIDYRKLKPVLDIEAAAACKAEISPAYEMRRGDAEAALKSAAETRSGRLRIGGQDHFYLEGQISFAMPGEDGEVLIYCSTQHPSEVQHNVARVLGVAASAVTVEVRRMGGGFGGKESQATQWAALAALVAARTGRPAKIRLDRDDDMIATGKRHDFLADYRVGFDAQGVITAVDATLAARCGFSKDLSDAICDRAMFHLDNTYYYGDVRIRSSRLATNTVSNTAFRGFGGPQGMLVGEWMIEEVARATGLDPLDVRKRNFYGGAGRNTTPYHMKVEDFVADRIVEELEESAEYRKRRKEIAAFNEASPAIRRGLALTPVKFGISFTTSFLNQAGALVHIYRDGSVHLNHGGTEMGQGLFIKVAQVVAEELCVDLSHVKITPTNTGKVPNTSATAASSGSDMNGMAARAAARTLRRRLTDFAAQNWNLAAEDVEFLPNRVRVGNAEIPFAELVEQAYLARVQLSATGFYRTPKLHWDREKARGRPFYYFSYGAACSEVAIDTLTGESRVLRVDILHDVGRSLNPATDLGQIEGGFIQGMGWLTSEELWWDGEGRLMTHAPSTYKIPTCGDRPEHFDIRIWEKGENREQTIHRSKAVGEPPLMLAISVFMAIADAISGIGGYNRVAALDAPATPERILAAVDDMRGAGA